MNVEFEAYFDKILAMESYLRSKGSRSQAPIPVVGDLVDALEYLRRHFAELGRFREEQMVRELRTGLLHGKKITVGEFREILGRVEILMRYARTKEKESGSYEGRLERKMMEFEHELAHLRSNPALEKKVAKLEEDLRKLRVASVIGAEGNEKKQEDMLKKYKSADKKVFVIMPFAPVFDDVWKGGIKRACNTEGFGCLRVDEISLSTWITEDIKEYMEMANVVITDITENNPNVMFELGWALAKDKKPIVIRQQDDPNKVPFDVQGIRYISYINSWSGIERLFTDIRKYIKSTSEVLGEKPIKQKSDKK